MNDNMKIMSKNVSWPVQTCNIYNSISSGIVACVAFLLIFVYLQWPIAYVLRSRKNERELEDLALESCNSKYYCTTLWKCGKDTIFTL